MFQAFMERDRAERFDPEAEVAQNAWLTVPADTRLAFETPLEDLWHESCRLLGVDLLHLSSDAGHA